MELTRIFCGNDKLPRDFTSRRVYTCDAEDRQYFGARNSKIGTGRLITTLNSQVQRRQH